MKIWIANFPFIFKNENSYVLQDDRCWLIDWLIALNIPFKKWFVDVLIALENCLEFFWKIMGWGDKTGALLC